MKSFGVCQSGKNDVPRSLTGRTLYVIRILTFNDSRHHDKPVGDRSDMWSACRTERHGSSVRGADAFTPSQCTDSSRAKSGRAESGDRAATPLVARHRGSWHVNPGEDAGADSRSRPYAWPEPRAKFRKVVAFGRPRAAGDAWWAALKRSDGRRRPLHALYETSGDRATDLRPSHRPGVPLTFACTPTTSQIIWWASTIVRAEIAVAHGAGWRVRN